MLVSKVSVDQLFLLWVSPSCAGNGRRSNDIATAKPSELLEILADSDRFADYNEDVSCQCFIGPLSFGSLFASTTFISFSGTITQGNQDDGEEVSK